jgi:chemotaxis protein MotD
MMAAFHLPATGKAALRVGTHTPPATKDGKDKAEHFREQLRSIAQGVKPGPQADTEDAEVAAMQGRVLPDRTAELTDEVKTRSKSRDGQSHKTPPQQAAGEVAAQPAEWRAPDAVLNAVVSRLDQAQALAPRDDGATPQVTLPHAKLEQADAPPKLGDLPKAPVTDGAAEQRFAVSVDAVETRIAPAVKVMVREQETHFEPVQQLTQLQKIVDRMATDLVAAPAAAGSADAAGSDLPRAADKPLRMLTLQLDPPDLGTVTVKMRLAGDAVEIRLTADRYETTEMLRQERGDLTDLMQSAGYSFDIASIDHSRAADANPVNAQSQGQSDQKPSQQPQGGSHFGGSSPQRQSSDAHGGTRHNRQSHDQIEKPAERHPDQKRVLNSNGSTLYL